MRGRARVIGIEGASIFAFLVACSSPEMRQSDQGPTKDDGSYSAPQDADVAQLHSADHAEAIDSTSGSYERILTIRLSEVILDAGLTRLLDSLIAFEKDCLGDDHPDFWLLGQWKTGVFQFTGTSGFTANALGFTMVDGNVVFLYDALPEAADQSDKRRSFSRSVSEASSGPEDYSAWYIQQANGYNRVVQAYTLPCN